MATSIVTLKPFNVQLGGYDPNISTPGPQPAPVAYGGGSIADDSDASYVEIGSWYEGTTASEKTDLLLADFQIDPTLNPTWCYISLRAKNDPAYPDALVNDSLYPLTRWYRTDDATAHSLNSENWPADLKDPGTVSTPTWFDYVYNNATVDPSNPSDAGNWLNLPRDWPELLDPLTTTGLRIGLFCTSSAATRVPLLDVYEIRLVVACVSSSVAPPLRQWPRSDGLGASSARRVWPLSPSIQASNRKVGGYL